MKRIGILPISPDAPDYHPARMIDGRFQTWEFRDGRWCWDDAPPELAERAIWHS